MINLVIPGVGDFFFFLLNGGTSRPLFFFARDGSGGSFWTFLPKTTIGGGGEGGGGSTQILVLYTCMISPLNRIQKDPFSQKQAHFDPLSANPVQPQKTTLSFALLWPCMCTALLFECSPPPGPQCTKKYNCCI